MDISDTIAAVATPPGRGGIGIIRVSGNKAMDAMKMLFRSRSRHVSPEPNKLYYGDITDLKSNIIDSGYAVFMKAPYSYTGEDTVEFHCHGSFSVLAKIMQILNEIGIRTAYPGEFTRRAFLNGRMDILQAEAVLDLVNASAEGAGKVALSQLKGDLSMRINKIKNEIINVLSNLDALIDFPEDVDESYDLEEIEKALNRIREDIIGLLSSYRTGRVLREGLLFQIIGKPNAGKSSIFNSILRRERAIVHSKPGTTRDYIEEELVMNGYVLRIVDSAGMWETRDEIEGEGIKKAMGIFKEADAFLLVIDSSCDFQMADPLIERIKGRHGIVVLNKSDLKRVVTKESLARFLSGWEILYTSAKTGDGIEELRSKISALCADLTPQFEPGIITKARHSECLNKSLSKIDGAISALNNSAGIVLVSDEVRRALKSIGELTGEELSEAVLDRIFSEFCVGK